MARLVEIDDVPAVSAKGKAFRLVEVDEQPSVPVGKQINAAFADIPRQLGLTARYGMEGVGDILDTFASPIRVGMNAIGINAKPGAIGALADTIGLPKPQNATERMVGDASRLMAGSAVPLVGAGKLADAATGTTQAVAKLIAANPLQQIASAGSAGLAGGYTRETGGNEASQALASLAAGVATPLAMNKTQQIGSAAKTTLQDKLSPQPELTAKLDLTIDNALKNSGITIGDLPVNIRNGIRTDVQAALKMDGTLSPEAIARLADYRLTGLTPRVGTLTLDPAIVSQEKNLAKLGINSKDPAAQQLGRVENANNRQLIDGLNDLGANTTDDALAGGQKIIGALQNRNDTAKSLIGERYDAARAANGRSAALDPSVFANQANDALDQALLGGKLPADVRNLLNKAATGEMPMTVDVAEQLKTRIGELQRSTADRGERKALGLVRQSLDDTPLLDGQGQEAIDAFNKARRLNRAWMGIVEKTPALQAVRDGVEPDKFVQTFVIGNGTNANTMDLAMLKRSVKGNPEAMSAVKTQITSYLKSSALSGAADDVGNFSQSAYNKALKAIGDRKLNLFFEPEELTQMKAIGRVSSYEQFQPKGSAVNNSNTSGAALSTLLDRIADSPLLSKIPFGQYISGPAQNISVGIKANQALSAPRGLIAPQLMRANQQPVGLLMSPAAFLGAEDKDKKGLLPF